jgi:hypothetical protein
MTVLAPGACVSGLTSCYISLAAFSQASAVLYGSTTSITYFASQIVKSTLAAQGTTKGVATGTQNLGTEYRVAIGRSGDMLLHTYTLVSVPEVKLTAATFAAATVGPCYTFGTITNVLGINQTVVCTTTNTTTSLTVNTIIPAIGAKWVKRLGHHIFREKCFDYSQLPSNRYGPVYADFYLNFAIPVDKKYGYLQMIGDVPELTRDGLTWWLPLDAQGFQGLPSKLLIVPDLFYYEHDTGFAVPMAALPYQEINATYNIHELDQLLSLWALTGTGVTVTTTCMKHLQPTANPSAFVSGSLPKFSDFATYLMYALLSNDERKSMGCGVRDGVIIQMQEQYVLTGGSDCDQTNTLLNFSHDVINLFFTLENRSNELWDKSNYTNFPSYITWGSTKDSDVTASMSQQVWIHCPGQDPAERYEVYYDNQTNIDAYAEVSSLYYPYINANCSGTLPDATGLNFWSYAYKNAFLLQPNGSVAYGRLSNVTIKAKHKPTTKAVCSASTTLSDYGVLADLWCDVLPPFRCVIGKHKPNGSIAAISDPSYGIAKQTFRFVVQARNWNPTRVAGGAIGFPLL